ncbi:MAG: abortive infection bacteriophage resistance protein [Flammeovirgaceae bacterium]
MIELYTFDRKLRNLIFDALERIEIALRTKLIYYLSIEFDHWWFENPEVFYNGNYHHDLLDEIDKELSRTKEVFIESHYKKYGDENRPPAYKTLEVVSFGCLSKMYSNLSNGLDAKKRIAVEMGLPNFRFLRSWLQTFNLIRNTTAHHSRIWNRDINFAPMFLRKTTADFISSIDNEHSMYHCLSCIIFVLNKVSPNHSLKDRIVNLVENTQVINLEDMGFPTNWKEMEIWK